jgi:hypothetical protein
MTSPAPVRIVIRHVVVAHHVIDALVVDAEGIRHRVGHLPAEGWFCGCPAGKRCEHIAAVAGLVPPMDDQTLTPVADGNRPR